MMDNGEAKVEYKFHNMPAVYVLETQMPQDMIDDVNG